MPWDEMEMEMAWVRAEQGLLLLYCESSGDIAGRYKTPGTWKTRPGPHAFPTWTPGRPPAPARPRPTRRLRCRAGNSRRSAGGRAIPVALPDCAGWAFAVCRFRGILIMRRLEGRAHVSL